MNPTLSLRRVPRVLILSASSGAGHVRAGQALEQAFRSHGGCSVEHVDSLEYVSKLFQKIYDDAYIAMIRSAPNLMGLLYKRMDHPWQHPSRRLAFDRLNAQPMIRILKRIQPDLCIATHFLPAEILSWLIEKKKKLYARDAIVVTDYDVHATALTGNMNRYYVALQEAAEYLARVGVPREKLCVTGIPIDPVFETPLSRREARRTLGLALDARILLISAGGYGVGPLEQLVRDLLNLNRPWQIVAIAGKGEELKECLDQMARQVRKLSGGADRLVPVGFTKEIDKYMAAADVLIGKAGGLTTSESLARALPMVLIDPIPGQEERNADHLLEAGAAIRCNNLPAAAWKIAALLDCPEKLRAMQAAAKAMARPGAARAIVEDALGLLH
jgi:processive 1,2-diacylglycerol beta-glucosyltransferase